MYTILCLGHKTVRWPAAALCFRLVRPSVRAWVWHPAGCILRSACSRLISLKKYMYGTRVYLVAYYTNEYVKRMYGVQNNINCRRCRRIRLFTLVALTEWGTREWGMPATSVVNKDDHIIYCAYISVQIVVYLSWQTWSLLSFCLCSCLYCCVFVLLPFLGE